MADVNDVIVFHTIHPDRFNGCSFYLRERDSQSNGVNPITGMIDFYKRTPLTAEKAAMLIALGFAQIHAFDRDELEDMLKCAQSKS